MKNVTVYRKDSGIEEFRGVYDALLHATGALVIVVNDGNGRVFASGTWETYDQEQTEGDSQEPLDEPGS